MRGFRRCDTAPDAAKHAASFGRGSERRKRRKVRHHGAPGYTPEECAGFLLARAAYLGKYEGFGAGLVARLGAVFGPLVRFRFGEFKNTLAGQKIDGTQM